VNALAFSSALNEARIREDFQVMRNSSGGNAAKGHEVAADHFFIRGDGFKNPEAGSIGQSL
jgi:hypothetical protein